MYFAKSLILSSKCSHRLLYFFSNVFGQMGSSWINEPQCIFLYLKINKFPSIIPIFPPLRLLTRNLALTAKCSQHPPTFFLFSFYTLENLMTLGTSKYFLFLKINIFSLHNDHIPSTIFFDQKFHTKYKMQPSPPILFQNFFCTFGFNMTYGTPSNFSFIYKNSSTLHYPNFSSAMIFAYTLH